MKTCTKCSETKPLTEFQKEGDRRRAQCKACRKAVWRTTEESRAKRRAQYALNREEILAKQKAWRDQHPERVKTHNATNRAKNPGRQYGLSKEQYESLAEEHQGLCAICKKPESVVHARTGEVQALAVDHDHACCPGVKSCGRCVRGLLCRACNTGLGMFGDDEDRLGAALQYLAARRAKRAAAE